MQKNLTEEKGSEESSRFYLKWLAGIWRIRDKIEEKLKNEDP